MKTDSPGAGAPEKKPTEERTSNVENVGRYERGEPGAAKVEPLAATNPADPEQAAAAFGEADREHAAAMLGLFLQYHRALQTLGVRDAATAAAFLAAYHKGEN